MTPFCGDSPKSRPSFLDPGAPGGDRVLTGIIHISVQLQQPERTLCAAGLRVNQGATRNEISRIDSMNNK